jgi:hypothetical protein
MSEANDWIEWNGCGKCPVAYGTLVDVRFSDGGEQGRTEAGYWASPRDAVNCWKSNGGCSDITHYRVAKP